MGSVVLIRNTSYVTNSKGLRGDCNINESVICLMYKTINTQNDQGISPCTETYRDYVCRYQMNMEFYCVCVF
jgi:hypothetical protein